LEKLLGNVAAITAIDAVRAGLPELAMGRSPLSVQLTRPFEQAALVVLNYCAGVLADAAQ
jgi:hypothetical protein